MMMYQRYFVYEIQYNRYLCCTVRYPSNLNDKNISLIF